MHLRRAIGGRRVAAGAGLALALLVAGCGSPAESDVWQDKPSPRVVASFPPLSCFAQNVMGDHGAVRSLCTTRGPHDYEYNPRDTLLLKKADILFSNGVGMDDHFIDRMHSATARPDLRLRKLGENVPRERLQKFQNHEHLGGRPHHHGEHDPHFWLGIPEAIYMVQAMRDELKAADPAHAADYQKNADAYVERLKKLHDEGREKLKGLRGVPIITFHESLGYFADSFGLTVGGSIQSAPGSDPQGARLKKLIDLCREQESKKPGSRILITVEPQYPNTAATTLLERLQREGIKAELVEIDPLETTRSQEDAIGKDWYEQGMRRNIDNLAKHAR